MKSVVAKPGAFLEKTGERLVEGLELVDVGKRQRRQSSERRQTERRQTLTAHGGVVHHGCVESREGHMKAWLSLSVVALVTSLMAARALGCIDYILSSCEDQRTACWLQASRYDVRKASEELKGAAEAFPGNPHYARACRLVARAQRELVLARAPVDGSPR